MAVERAAGAAQRAAAHRIAVIPGDGIGREVVPEALRVLAAAGTAYGFTLETVEFPWSCRYYLDTGAMMPPDGLDTLAGFDAVFLGAVGHPSVPDHVSLWGLLIPIRRRFGQYVNLRPVKLFDGIRSPLRGATPETVDVAIVRENNEGEYSEIGGRLYSGTPDEVVVQQSVFTRRGTERVIRYAFDLARARGRRLASATKSNGIIHTMPFWDEVFAQVGAGYPDVAREQLHIDALAAALVLNPARFDVIVGSNLFGDILSDLAAAVAGSIGIAPSANLDPTGAHPSMFEPVHGSAPDIAGRGIANPIGQVWSGALMLRHLGHGEAAGAVERAIGAVLRGGGPLTPDLGGSAGTSEVTDRIIAAIPAPGAPG